MSPLNVLKVSAVPIQNDDFTDQYDENVYTTDDVYTGHGNETRLPFSSSRDKNVMEDDEDDIFSCEFTPKNKPTQSILYQNKIGKGSTPKCSYIPSQLEVQKGYKLLQFEY